LDVIVEEMRSLPPGKLTAAASLRIAVEPNANQRWIELSDVYRKKPKQGVVLVPA
jgi:hypothetical protein